MSKSRDVFAVETSYKGTRFRSSAEARWAVFFDHLNLQWRYEVEGFTDGVQKYLPDFHLPEIGWFLEVKGSGADYDVDKVTLAVHATGNSLIVWGGEPAISWAYKCETCPVSSEAPIAYIPSTPDPDPDPDDPFAVLTDDPFEDHPFWWCQCPRCKKVGLAFDAESDRLPCNCNQDDPNAGHTEALHRAFTAARNYRFWGQGRASSTHDGERIMPVSHSVTFGR